MPTPVRTFRAPDDEYDDAAEVAKERGEDLTTAIRRFLRSYGAPARHRRSLTPHPIRLQK